MRPVSRFSYLKVLAVVGLVVLGGAALPAAAEAQARGTLQASATVVDTKQGFGALDAARAAVRSATDSRPDSRIGSPGTVATVAQISVERQANQSSALLVTIDYSRN
jgi:Sec-independent protein translocase protein TatA